MEEKIVIYVAGNPDAYPLEYYDPGTESYQGVIPRLLRQFSEESRYEISYYGVGRQDQREHLAKNRQVDILSGYAQNDTAPPECQAVPVFQTVQKGETMVYQVYVGNAATKSLKADLDAFFASVGQEYVSGLVLDCVSQPVHSQGLYVLLGSLALLVVVLAALIPLLARRYRKKLKKAEQGLEIDETTGLGNMDYLTRYYKQFVNDKNRLLYSLLYFYVDTDRLRRLGSNEETNEFLRYCAVVLQEYTADTDILARVSDHGFVLLRLWGKIQEAGDWISPILYRIRAYSEKYDKPYDVNMSAGIYPLKATDRDLNEMIFSASQSAYAAERTHQDYVICSDEMLQKLLEERRLQADIERALANQEFELYVQFYVDTDSYKIVGGEALSRWKHPQKGLLAPDLFVPLMEREGKISKLDYYCLDKVCAFLHDLGGRDIETFFISCNFSRDTFTAVDFVDNCKEIISKYHFARELLIFEITESAAAKNIAQLHKNALALKEYGIRMALDDFGEGFTSFYDLQQYPVDGIKLDKSLIDNVLTNKGKAILRAMIQVGHELELTILAEGVETDEQVEALRLLCCDVIQGYRFYYPMPEWEAKNKIAELSR